MRSKNNNKLNFLEKIKKIFCKENIILFLIPFLFFTFLLLVFYPGIITYDGNYQWQQVINNNINNNHPFFSTYFQFILSKIWDTPTVVLVYQVLFFSISWSCICHYVRVNKNDFKKQVGYTILISIIPIFSLYSISLWKDILYSYYLMILLFFFYKGIKEKFDFSYSNIILISIFSTLVFNYRFNGMIVAVLIFITYLIIFVIKKITWKKTFLLFICFILLDGLIAIPKKNYMKKIEKESIDNNISISTLDGFIIWMYGSLIKNGNISDEDLTELDKIMPIEKWKEIYDPYLINSMSYVDRDDNYFIDNHDTFINMFLKNAIKNPDVILVHYLKSDALLWSPIPIGYVYSFEFTEWGPIYGFNNGQKYGFERSIPEMRYSKQIFEYYVTFLNKKPIRAIIYQPATIMYISLILIFGLVSLYKDKKYWLLSLPMIYNILSLLLINPAQDLRYVYINYLTLLFVGLLVLINYKKNNKVFNRIFIGIISSCILISIFVLIFR